MEQQAAVTPALDRSTAATRSELIEELARWIDGSERVLGPGGAAQETAKGAEIRSLKMDRAILGPFPEVVTIAEEGFLQRDQSVPATFAALNKQYRFLWMRLPIGLFPAAGWAYNRLEVTATLHADGPGHLQPRVIHILPPPEVEKLAEATVMLAMSFGADLGLDLRPLPADLPLPANAAVELRGAEKAGLSAGPIIYQAVKAKVEHSPPGLDWVNWRLSDARLYTERTPELVMIVQVPREATGLSLVCEMQARRYFHTFTAEIQDLVAQVSTAIQALFRGGLPTPLDEKTYDLSAVIDR